MASRAAILLRVAALQVERDEALERARTCSARLAKLRKVLAKLDAEEEAAALGDVAPAAGAPVVAVAPAVDVPGGGVGDMHFAVAVADDPGAGAAEGDAEAPAEPPAPVPPVPVALPLVQPRRPPAARPVAAGHRASLPLRVVEAVEAAVAPGGCAAVGGGGCSQCRRLLEGRRGGHGHCCTLSPAERPLFIRAVRQRLR